MNQIKKVILSICCCGCSMVYAQHENKAAPEIEYIDIIHFCHTDYGFTDDPAIAEELHRKYLDIGIDAVLETVNDKSKPKFYWTAEVLETVDTWWKNATPERRKELLKAVKSGQLEVAAMPFNVQPFYNSRQIDKIVNWMPDELWNQLKPEVAIQHDVNGFPRAAVAGLMDKGVRYFWSGLNLHWGGIFHKPPYAFWWEMSDGRKALVWLGMPYWEGYDFFAESEWRYAQRQASNTQFRTPRTGDMLQSDEASVRAAHKVCLTKIAQMQAEGYSYDFIATSLTNQYRCDNDGPYPAFAAFVAKWNELGLKPTLVFTTAKESMKKIEARLGDKIATHKGEWPDWWSFGIAASPRELSASRQANLYIEAAESPVWGEINVAMKKQTDAMDRDLCRYYEHTCGSWETNSNPYSLFTQSHFNVTSSYAYRPYQRAQWLLAQRVRVKLTNEKEGLYIVNTGSVPYTGWVDIDPASFVRQPYTSVINSANNKQEPFFMSEGYAKLWIENMKPGVIAHYQFSTHPASFDKKPVTPDIHYTKTGWPQSVKWATQSEVLLTEGFGDLSSLNSLVGRSVSLAWNEPDSCIRKKRIADATMENYSSFGNTTMEETPYSLIYKQKMIHKSMNYAERRLEIWKTEPRVTCKVTIDRISNSNPEILYIHFPFSKEVDFPVTSSGGMKFVPYKEQLPGTCTDFLAIDGWVSYPLNNGSWVWSSRDAALVTFGGNQFGVKSQTPPCNMNHLCAMICNNMLEVNYLIDFIGRMEFVFDVAWMDGNQPAKVIYDATNTYLMKPVIYVNPATREDKHTFKYTHRIE